MDKWLAILVFLLLANFGFSQCKISNSTFSSGESANYSVYYKLGFIWFNAAEVNFTAKSRIINQTKAYHFISEGKTLPSYDWLYKVRDRFESVADSATLNPVWFHRNSNEGGYSVNNEYEFYWNEKKIYSKITSSKKPLYYDTLPYKSCTYDVLTAIYACRNINFSSKNIYDTIPLQMLIDNEIYPLFIRYLGKENITLKNNRSFNCVKFSILLVEGTIFSGGEDMTVWVTDDRAKVPVQVQAQILVGSIIATLENVRGLRWPITGEIKTPETN